MSSARIPFALRSGTDADVGFVVRSWLGEMRASPLAAYVPNEVYRPGQRALIHQLLSHGALVIACDPDSPGVILGCCAYQPADIAIVHWVYVAGSYRRLGVGRALLEAVTLGRRPVFATQATRLLLHDLKPQMQAEAIIYDPYLLLGVPPDPALLVAHEKGRAA